MTARRTVGLKKRNRNQKAACCSSKKKGREGQSERARAKERREKGETNDSRTMEEEDYNEKFFHGFHTCETIYFEAIHNFLTETFGVSNEQIDCIFRIKDGKPFVDIEVEGIDFRDDGDEPDEEDPKDPPPPSHPEVKRIKESLDN